MLLDILKLVTRVAIETVVGLVLGAVILVALHAWWPALTSPVLGAVVAAAVLVAVLRVSNRVWPL